MMLITEKSNPAPARDKRDSDIRGLLDGTRESNVELRDGVREDRREEESSRCVFAAKSLPLSLSPSSSLSFLNPQ